MNFSNKFFFLKTPQNIIITLEIFETDRNEIGRGRFGLLNFLSRRLFDTFKMYHKVQWIFSMNQSDRFACAYEWKGVRAKFCLQEENKQFYNIRQ